MVLKSFVICKTQMKLAVIYVQSLGRSCFKLFQISLTGKISSRTSKEREGGLSLSGKAYKNLHSQRDLCMYSVDILKFPKKSYHKNQIFLR